MTRAPATSTVYVSMRSFGTWRTWPVVTSYGHPQPGQVTSSPSTAPEASSDAQRMQSPSTATILPLTLNSASSRAERQHDSAEIVQPDVQPAIERYLIHATDLDEFRHWGLAEELQAGGMHACAARVASGMTRTTSDRSQSTTRSRLVRPAVASRCICTGR